MFVFNESYCCSNVRTLFSHQCYSRFSLVKARSLRVLALSQLPLSQKFMLATENGPFTGMYIFLSSCLLALFQLIYSGPWRQEATARIWPLCASLGTAGRCLLLLFKPCYCSLLLFNPICCCSIVPVQTLQQCSVLNVPVLYTQVYIHSACLSTRPQKHMFRL